jgi:tetratricopeptide (TPR) repeat protein
VTQPQRPDGAALQAACDEGRALHQAGRLDEASLRYQQVLAADPAHFDALHLLGVLCIQTGRPDIAVELIGQAIAAQPGVAIAHGNLGNALNILARHEEALAASDRAIALNPLYAEAHGNRGRALHGLGRSQDAAASYGQVIALKPTARAYYNHGVMLRDLGRTEEALASFAEATARDGTYAEAHCSQGIALRELGRPREALVSLDRALALKPAYAEAHYERAVALRELKQPAAALESYDRAIALKPGDADAHSNRGNALTDLKRYEEALESYRRAIALKPDYAEAYSNQMVALRELKRPQEALAACDQAIALKPDYAEAHNNRAGALYEFQRLDEVLESCDRAIALKPGYAEAHSNRGSVLHQLRRPQEALDAFDRAIVLKPAYAEAHYHQAMVQLMLGDYAKAWLQYEWRWKTVQFEEAVRAFEAPLWLGREDIRGRTILLHAEQGLGDALQFFRYAPKVAALGATVILEVYAGLERLAARLDGVSQVVTRGAPLPPHDFQTPLMSLPLALGLEPEADGAPYLSADPQAAAAWSARLGDGAGLRVGLCWAGGTRPDQPIAHTIDKRRSLRLESFAPLAGIAGVQIYSLQKGPPSAQLAEIGSGWPGPPIIDLTADLNDFADTADLAANLDLVISCDTSTAHLAGGLGKPLWVLNRYDACWRWLADREDSPWYPSARLFQQKSPGDWDGVIEEVRAALTGLAGRT